MRNPLRTEAEAFRFLVVVIAGAIVVVAAAYINTWVGVAAAVLVIGGRTQIAARSATRVVLRQHQAAHCERLAR